MKYAFGLLLGLLLASCQSDPSPDHVLVNGHVLTINEAGTVATALAIQGERIIAVGSTAEIEALVGPDTQVTDLDGRTVIPGLGDNHFHSIGGGPGVDLSGVRSMAELKAKIAERAASIPEGELILTNSNWHEGQLAEQRLCLRDDLDEAAPNHPVVVVRGGHQLMLNSAALEKWNINESTPERPGGRIGRYSDGRLNGELVDRAKDLVAIPKPAPRSASERLDDLERDFAILSAAGLTGIRIPGTTVEMYHMIDQLRKDGRLALRVELLFRVPNQAQPAEIDSMLTAWSFDRTEDDWLSVGGVKLMVDGGFEGGLMREPYLEPYGKNGTYHGLQVLTRDTYQHFVDQLNESGWRVVTHAVGDAGIDLILDVYEASNQKHPIAGRGWAIEHGFIPREDQFPRMRNLGLSVTAQNHLYVAAPSLVRYWGQDRANWTTPVKAYLDADIPVSLGTDSPVIPYNPWWVLHHFVTRESISAGVMGPDQRITVNQAFRLMTQAYADLVGASDRGSLEVGKLADLVVLGERLSGDLDSFDAGVSLQDMEVDLTMVGGRVVFER